MPASDVRWRYRALCFVSSFLLFEVELLIARLLSPRFGSSAAVWTTSLVFFQGVLLVGYLFAERVALAATRGTYRWAHLAVVLIPIICFPFHLIAVEGPPVLAVLAALGVSIGLPFLALSTTTIVAQGWCAGQGGEGTDPYRLYGTSNAGALLALLTYPLIISPHVALHVQLGAWYLGYAVFALLIAACVPPRRVAVATVALVEQRVPWIRSASWLLFSAASNALLMAVTNAISLDASVPLLWVVPLALYLLTLIACFGRVLPSWNRVLLVIAGLLVVAAGGVALVVRDEHVEYGYLIIHNVVVAVGCLACHWNLAKLKPGAESLGRYYLLMAVGGFGGSLFVGLISPVVFSHFGNPQPDYAVILILLMAAFLARDAIERTGSRRAIVSVIVLVLAALGSAGAAEAYAHLDLYSSRTFYGFYGVRQEGDLRAFKHGNTVHGLEHVDSMPDEPLAYYHRGSPIGRLLLRAPHLARQRVGLVGLGVGSLAAYSKPGEQWTFIEIDPEVEHVARTYFRFLERAPGTVDVKIADARLELEREGDARYDLLIMDAFSSDSVPLHLLTREAMESYLRALKQGGIIIFHVSSRFIDLPPELGRQAEGLGLRAFALDTEGDGQARYPSQWFAMARDAAGEQVLAAEAGFIPYQVPPNGPPQWTDDRVDILDLLGHTKQ